jgi:membrane protein
LPKAGLPGQVLGRLIEVRFLDRTVILAAQGFSAILPLFIVVTTISPRPGGDSPAAFLARRLGLTEEVSSLQVAVVPPPTARASIGVLGVVLALLTATSFARALQRSYELAWRLPRAGLLTAVGFAVLRLLSAFYLPTLVASNLQQFGLLRSRSPCSPCCGRARW